MTKQGLQVVAKFFVEKEGGKDLLRIDEQYVYDVLKDAVQEINGSMKNGIQPLNKKRGRLRDAFRKFPACK